MKYPDECPNCKAVLVGAEIPKEEQEAYGTTHYYRVISVYDRAKGQFKSWQCPDCRHEWKREKEK